MARYGRLAELDRRIKALEARVTKLEALAGDYDEPVCEEDERYGDPY